MFYHVLIETSEKNKKGTYTNCYELDSRSLDDIKKYIVNPYKKEEKVYIDGRYIAYSNIRQLKVFQSESSTESLREKAQSKISKNILLIYTRNNMLNENHMKDITKELLFND
ncbi:hypothetical protein DKL61_09705 [Gammaproteobacteria bacterium ESL0073]|nr:hypothetical protein DKL61_09705 [Gammaproteobacteria bacterium ESL0073]